MIDVRLEVLKEAGSWKVPFQMGVEVYWPASVTHGGQTFYRKNKEGISKDGLPCAEYERGGVRVWLCVTGEVREE